MKGSVILKLYLDKENTDKEERNETIIITTKSDDFGIQQEVSETCDDEK